MDSKEEKKKKAHRKRDRFWKLVFPHYYKFSSKSRFMSSKEKRTSEQNNKITLLSNYAQNNFSVTLDHELFASILESHDWDSKKSMADLIDYEEASHGILVEPPNSIDKQLLGSENDGGTSCYIDALLFAMFIANTTFDPLLTYDIPSDQDEKIKLQTLMRLFVNKLRKGHLVNADYVHWLRKVMKDAKWSGQNDLGEWTQEDASELFMFITETFDLPYLPFQIRLFHGANKDTDDDRVMTDRTLTLSIPDNSNDSTKEDVKLQDILVDYFYNNIITGVRRQVDCDVEQNVTENMAEANSKNGMRDEQAVTAWQVLELLPFYTASNEQGEPIKTQVDSSFPDTHMILPIVLKRYRYNNSGGSVKMKTHVEIPPTIDFNRFVNQNVDDPMCPTCGHLINWTLHFKSAVCHKGDSPYSGHYISYARVMMQENDDQGNHDPLFYWLKLDDMNASSRVTQINASDSSTVCQDLAENAYIVFYELDKTCHHRRNSLGLSSTSSINSEIIETQQELKPTDSFSSHETDTEEQHCNCDKKNTKSKTKTTTENLPHHHHHHHHHRHYLKDSCRLM
ncbi:ubiquitin carboxyl-terminal hydrolase-domain-containing protein [Parasitella parasitica]|nr:ubiquitin carboxyl-terminal hydrolase-domain-containing protein [Parasitella parasitica]